LSQKIDGTIEHLKEIFKNISFKNRYGQIIELWNSEDEDISQNFQVYHSLETLPRNNTGDSVEIAKEYISRNVTRINKLEVKEEFNWKLKEYLQSKNFQCRYFIDEYDDTPIYSNTYERSEEFLGSIPAPDDFYNWD